MSAPAHQPWFLNSLSELSRTLDEPPDVPPLQMVVVPIDESTAVPLPLLESTPEVLPLLVDLPTSGRRRPVRRLGGHEGWLIGLAGLGGLWLLYCGLSVLGAQASQPPPMFDRVEAAINVVDPVLNDPVLDRGRAPQLIDPRDEAAECAGTSVNFVPSLAAATRQAKENDKLLMVLNVSGDFEDSRFT